MTTQIEKHNAAALAVERRFADKIISLQPACGEKSKEFARELVACGMSPTMSAMLLDSVWNPQHGGRGQGIRWLWFVEAIKSRYKNRLEKIGSSVSAFRNFLADMDEVDEMRSEINESSSFTFQETFLLWEIGLDSETVCGHMSDLLCETTPGRAKKILIHAAKNVKSGSLMNIETGLKECLYAIKQSVE